jgi:hypothetical protein
MRIAGYFGTRTGGYFDANTQVANVFDSTSTLSILTSGADVIDGVVNISPRI